MKPRFLRQKVAFSAWLILLMTAPKVHSADAVKPLTSSVCDEVLSSRTLDVRARILLKQSKPSVEQDGGMTANGEVLPPKKGQRASRKYLESLEDKLVGAEVKAGENWAIRKLWQFLAENEDIPLSVAKEFVASVKLWETTDELARRQYYDELKIEAVTLASRSYGYSGGRLKGPFVFFDDHVEHSLLGILFGDAILNSPEFEDLISGLSLLNAFYLPNDYYQLKNRIIVKVLNTTAPLASSRGGNAGSLDRALKYLRTMGVLFPGLSDEQKAHYVDRLRAILHVSNFQMKFAAMLEFLVVENASECATWCSSGGVAHRYERRINEAIEFFFTPEEILKMEVEAKHPGRENHLRRRIQLAIFRELRKTRLNGDKP